MMTLYQFPISHFCEKARWALEYKGIDYRIKNLVPGPHIAAVRKIAPGSSVPVLVDGDAAVQGSDAIISYLDAKHPELPLTPATPEGAALAQEWEQYADDNLGVPLRLFFYFHVLPNRELASALLTEDCPWWAGPLYKLIFPTLRERMRAAMHIDPENAREAEASLLVAFDHIEQRLSGREFLAGPRFSRADLAVSALLAPSWRFSDPLPEALDTFIAAQRDRPLLEWARGIYDDYRHTRR